MNNNIALIPWGDIYLRDEIFNLNNSMLNRDNGLVVWITIKMYLKRYGFEFHTVDMYSDLTKVDLFVFLSFNIKWYKKIKGWGGISRSLYFAFEPPVVDINHNKQGIKLLKKYFSYIMTWNDELIDNHRIYKFMYPYCFDYHSTKFNISYEEFLSKKLLCNISGNKKSAYKGELYTERARIIDFYKNNPDFGLYGSNWDNLYSFVYQGFADNKKNIYSNYRFAICLENMCNIQGYVTEKILDCFCCGIVPIYLGASNCNSYIPDNCYIHYDNFSDLNELNDFLTNMEFEQYKGYLSEIQKYLMSDKISVFDPINIGKSIVCIYKLVSNSNVNLNGNIHVYSIKSKIHRIYKSIVFKYR